MRFLKTLFLVLAIIVAILLVAGFFLPKESHVERSITINSSMDKVFNQVNSFQNFNQWSPWAELDPNTVYTFSGPEAGVGNKMEWTSEKQEVGSGSQEIIESEYPRRVKAKLMFGADPNPGYATYLLEEVGNNQVKVTWSFDADFGGNVIYRYFGLMMDKMLGPDYEKGLAKLKTQLEK